MNLDRHYDVIVIGAGHAGTEAAMAAARMGSRTLLLTHNIETLGQMSCNPAIGGIGKGHLVKEIDAMGGVMAKAIDRAGIQFRTLNMRKGPAVRATRAQADRELYKRAIRYYVEAQENLVLFQQPVDDLIVEQDRVVGVITSLGLKFYAKAVVLTAGTFLAGKIHVGDQQHSGGRAGDPPAMVLSQRLRDLPFRVGRLKTGTPPRIDRRSINYAVLPEQPGDTPTPVFSFTGHRDEHPQQVACHISHTTEKTHEIIRNNLHRSAMYSGNIEGIGPRYCPSIEDKIVRFADKTSHQIFVEPEGLTSFEVYPNGISTSLPFEVQELFVRSMHGFEQAMITRPGYAIEYDFFDPRDLRATLETKSIGGLFFAGQINGTTGYEEAAAQGLMAGLNAALQAQEKEPFVLRRDQAYIGVLIDDLMTQGAPEPYRMFTSRAEYRLMLREDNADQRLTPDARQLGLVKEAQWRAFDTKMATVDQEMKRIKTTWVQPGNEPVETLLGQALAHEYCLADLLKRPEMTYQQFSQLVLLGPWIEDPVIGEQLDVRIKYAGYIDRQQSEIDKQARHENAIIPAWMNYEKVIGLSNEVRQKLTQAKPETIGIASRIPGVTPAAISLLLVHLK